MQGVRAVVAAVVASVLLGAGCSSSAEPMPVPVSEPRQPRGEVLADLVVDRVVDGDTVKVSLGGRQESVRLIGINTPETVKPDSPVECFGQEASAFATQLLDGQPIVLELDESQGYRDRYDRVLAYVWRVQPDGSLRLFNEEAVLGGYAYERQYTDDPYAWRPELAAAQERARSEGAGLWNACPQP